MKPREEITSIFINGKEVTKIEINNGLFWERLLDLYLNVSKTECWVTEIDADLFDILSNTNWNIQ